MADEIKTVKYELVGDATNLINTINKTLAQLEQLQTKLNTAYTSITSGKATTTNVLKSKGIISAQTNIAKLQSSLSSLNLGNLTTDQAAQIGKVSTAVELLDKNIGALNTKYGLSKSKIDAASASLNTCASTLAKVSKATNKTATNTGKLSDKFKKAISSGLFWYTVLRRIAQWLYQGYKDAQGFAETVNLFNVAAGESAEKLSELATTMENTFHGNIAEYLKQIALFKQYANTIGLASEKAEIFSETLTKLGADLASLYNTTNETAYSAILSGLAGNTKMLMNQFGISVHKSTLEMELLRLGIDKTYSSLNQTEKVVLRYITILRQASSAQGDLAKTLESPENQFKILTAQLKVLMRNIGSFVVVIAKVALPIINGFIISLNKALEAMARVSGYKVEDYSNNLNATSEGLEDITDAAEDTEEALKGSLAPLDEINQATVSEKGVYGEIDQRLLDALAEYDNLMDAVSTKTDKYAAIFEKVFNMTLFKSVGTLLGQIFDLIDNGLTTAINLIDIVSPLLTPILTFLGYILQAVSIILTPINALLEGLNSTDEATRAWSIAGVAALGVVLSLITAMKLYNTLMALGNNSLLEGIKFLWDYVAASAAAIAKKLKDIIVTKAHAAAQWWENASLAAKITLVTMGAGLAVVAAAGTAAAIMSSKGDKTVEVPAMATGGVTTGPTVALIGEKQYQEAVIPLGNSPQFKSMKDDIASEVARILTPTPASRVYSGASVGGTPVEVVLQLDGRTLARATLPYLGSTQSQTGIKLK